MSALEPRQKKMWELSTDAVYGYLFCEEFDRAAQYLVRYRHLVNLKLRKVRISKRDQRDAVEVKACEGRLPFLTPVYLLFGESLWCLGRTPLVAPVRQETLILAGLDLLSCLRAHKDPPSPGSYWHDLAIQTLYFFKCLTVDLSRVPEHPMHPFLRGWQQVLGNCDGAVSEAIIWGERFLDRSVETGDLRVVPEIW